MVEKSDKNREDRFASPEGAGSDALHYFDEKGNRLSAAAWLEKVKADSKRSRPSRAVNDEAWAGPVEDLSGH